MKAKFLIAPAMLTVLSAPALASAPDASTGLSNRQMVQPAPNRYPGDTYDSELFGERWHSRGDMGVYERRHSNQAPPGMDASGVPDPRG
jgi:hypothetical protein